MNKTIIAAFLILMTALVGLAQNNDRIRVPTLSPITTIEQEVALTRVKLTYSRPSAKGREIYGGLVPFGEIWRTGANASTKLTFTEDVKIAGNELKAGTYALYTIPGKDEWTMIIHRNLRLRSLAGDVYKPADDVFRFKAKPMEMAGYVETFTIGFGDITSKTVKVHLDWEKTRVSFPIEFNVFSQVDKQIAELSAKGAMNGFNLFRAAEFYLHNDRDMNTALKWINEALVKSPKNFRFGLLKAKIQYKADDREAALVTIAEANAWARERKNANYIKQTQDFWDSIKD